VVYGTFSYKRLGKPQNQQAATMNLAEMSQGLPKTELLYLRHMQLATTQANILKVVPEKRTQAYLVLDRTIFHPKGGGQPSDRGKMTSTQFALEIKKAIHNQGVVIHWAKIVNGAPSTGPVSCELDWAYRYLVMRRHTAAHLLDHCLAKTNSTRVETTDSWLDEPCYVGYRGNPPDALTIDRAQELADKMIAAGAPVNIDFLTPEQSKQVLKSAPNFERLPDLQEIRTVTIEGCDSIPCGGTHVSNIKEIGRMSILKAEQMPDQTFRMHFSV
jgi:alanyl-tRNA synthetase